MFNNFFSRSARWPPTAVIESRDSSTFGARLKRVDLLSALENKDFTQKFTCSIQLQIKLKHCYCRYAETVSEVLLFVLLFFIY